MLDHVAQINPYLEGVFAPVDDELDVQDLEVEGELPEGLVGAYMRNSPNPRFTPPGRYHWFDGDGMVHALAFEGGRATYRNRYVRTRSFGVEHEAGEAVWGGILDPIKGGLPGGPLKNTSNTDLVWHAGRLLSLWWLGAEPYELDPSDLSTLGTFDFGGAHKGGVSAHPKVDPRTGELVFMDFSFFKPPFLSYGVASASGELTRFVPIEIPGPRILHDLAITERHTILLDLPLLWDPEALRHGKRKIVFDTRLPSRFGILPRHGDNADVRWFECDPCYIYHTINAWEEGDEVVLLACRVANPMPKAEGWDGTIPRLYFLELQPFMYRWRFNLVTGQVKEERIDDVSTEFPRMNDDRLGLPTRFSYNPRVAPLPRLLFDGLIKYDTDAGTSEAWSLPKGHFTSEPVFVPRPGARAEDDGWVISFVHDARDGATRVEVLNADDFAAGPVATVRLPRRVPIGFHACWVPGPLR